MRNLLLINFLLIAFISNGQIIEYYQSAFDKKDDSLKLELYNVIKDHTEFTYTSSSTDVWDILKDTDRDPNNSDNVILLYSGISVDAAQEYNSGSGWTREHVWAKSRGDFGTDKGAGTDVHHLRPEDSGVNSTRNNRNFDNCVDCETVMDGNIDTGSQKDGSLWTFEPRDEVKGDVARMIFYMTVRYEGEDGEPDLELTNSLLTNTDKSPLHAVMSTLLEWHRADTVSDWERNRNEIIYNDYQHNRNPFIDYPELAEYLLGDMVGSSWNPTTPPLSISEDHLSYSIYPNPASNQITINGSYESYQITNNQGQVLASGIARKVISVSHLKKGIYYLTLISENNRITKKIIKE